MMPRSLWPIVYNFPSGLLGSSRRTDTDISMKTPSPALGGRMKVAHRFIGGTCDALEG